jgi:hypothetical protein
MAKPAPIRPLFTNVNNLNSLSDANTLFITDDYNKKSDKTTLIDAKTDGQAILAFLNEYKGHL